MTVTTQCIPYKESGSALTGMCTADVVGCTFVKISGDRTGGGGAGGGPQDTNLSADLHNVYSVATATAAGAKLGVAKHSALDGSLVGIHCQPGLVLPILSGAAINSGVEVEIGSAGTVVTYSAGIKVGYCLNGTSGANQLAEIKLY